MGLAVHPARRVLYGLAAPDWRGDHRASARVCLPCCSVLQRTVQVRAIIVETSVPMFHVYGGGCPPRRSIGPKMSPVRRKIPLGAPSGAFGTDGDEPVSLTCSARERPGTAKSACHRSINRGYGWRERGWWGGFRGWCLVCRGRHHF